MPTAPRKISYIVSTLERAEHFLAPVPFGTPPLLLTLLTLGDKMHLLAIGLGDPF